MTDSQSASSAKGANGGRKLNPQREARRKGLLASARKLFLARGFHQTSVAAIVAEAGVAQGTFYLYFKSKQSVLPHLRVEVLNAYLKAWGRGAAQSDDPRADARLVAGLRQVAEAVRKQRGLVRLLREATEPAEQQQVWIEGRARMAEPLSELIDQGIEDKTLQADDSALTAQLALALLDDLLYEALEYELPAPIEQTFAHSTRFLLRALRCDEARVRELVPMPSQP